MNYISISYHPEYRTGWGEQIAKQSIPGAILAIATLGGSLLASQHWEMGIWSGSIRHKMIASLECMPILGGVAAAVERSSLFLLNRQNREEETFYKNYFQHRKEPLTRECIQKLIRDYDPWREYDLLPSTEPKAIAMASMAVKHPELGLRKEGLQLFYALVRDLSQHEATFDPAIKAALAAASDTSIDVRTKGLEILQELVGRWKYVPAYETAKKAAETTLGEQNVDLRLKGLDLYRQLVWSRYEPAFEMALKMAQAPLGEANIRLCRERLRLYTALIQAGHKPSFEPAEKMANDALKEPYTTSEGLQLYTSLIRSFHEPAYEPAINAVLTTVNKPSNRLISDCIELCNALLDANYVPVCAAAATVAQIAIDHPFSFEIEKGMYLYIALIEKNYEQAYAPATKAAHAATLNESTKDSSVSLLLLATLVKANYADAYEPAKAAAQEKEGYESYKKKESREKLKNALIAYEERNHGRILIFNRSRA